MSSRIVSYFRSLDQFGEPVALNYKGESHFKTGIGAIFSIALGSFMLILTILGTIDLIQYKDP